MILLLPLGSWRNLGFTKNFFAFQLLPLLDIFIPLVLVDYGDGLDRLCWHMVFPESVKNLPQVRVRGGVYHNRIP
jgi:hypothetical protein